MTYPMNNSCVDLPPTPLAGSTPPSPTSDQGTGEDTPLGHLATRDLPEQKCRIALSAASRHIPFPSHANFRHQPLASSGTSSKEDFSFLGAGHGACDQPVEPTCTGSK